LALKLLMTEGERRPDMLRQRVCAGVKQAYEFQRGAIGHHGVTALVNVSRGRVVLIDCIFSSVFKECIASSRQQRHGLFSNLLSLFEIGDSHDYVEETKPSPKRRRRSSRSSGRSSASSGVDLDMLSFASQILAHLPYSTAGDPLYIIHKITSIMTLQGAELLDLFASVLRPVGLSSSDEYDETNDVEDALERAAKTKFPGRTQEAMPLSSDKFERARFVLLCKSGAGLILLLRLKSFLRRLYNLSERRCIEYDPSAKEHAGGGGVSKSSSESTKPFTCKLPISVGDKQNNDDSLIRQYAEFRSLMRDEASMAGSPELGSDDDDDDDDDTGNAASKKRPAQEITSP
jgi:cohesin loading factor subunit SCC2